MVSAVQKQALQKTAKKVFPVWRRRGAVGDESLATHGGRVVASSH
jgi:hypothetical protein